MNFRQIKVFSQEFRKLLKKYKTLQEDLKVFQKNIIAVDLSGNKNFAILFCNEKVQIIKARFFCRYLKGSSLRIIYAYYEQENFVEFLEIYFKGNKVSEDKKRIKDYLKNF